MQRAPRLHHQHPTRVLVAWQLGLLVLAVAVAALAMPGAGVRAVSAATTSLTAAGRRLYRSSSTTTTAAVSSPAPTPRAAPAAKAAAAAPRAQPQTPARVPPAAAATKPSPAPGAARRSPAAGVRAFSGGAGSMAAQQAFKYREPVVFNAREKHTGTVIMLHGLGDSGDGWAPIGVDWAPEMKQTKFLFPHAPDRPITVNFGMRMPGWYDIASLDDINGREDKAGLLESKRYIESLVEAEVAAGVPSERVVVAGFSQGGAVALMMLRSEHKLAGVVGLSTYLPLRKEPPLISAPNKATPIFQAHGDADTTVAYKFGVETHNLLKEAGGDVTFRTYNGMAHGAVPQEIADVGAFLKKVLPPQ